MKCVEQTKLEEIVQTSAETLIQLPMGLLGFEKVMNYHLLSGPGEAPFSWLQIVENPGLSFLVLPAGEFIPEYQPEISDEDAAFLQLMEPSDALVLNIVTLNDDGRATVNLKGPIVINRQTLKGKQVIPRNVSSYSLKHPLSVDVAA